MSIFSKIKGFKPRTSKFDLGHERKFSLKMAELVPILVQDVVPGDRFRVSTEIMLRFAPMLAPIMHRVNVFTHYFFVPNRLVWDEWEDFITGGRTGDAAPVSPWINVNNDSVNGGYFEKGTLADYMGIPWLTDSGEDWPGYPISALPFRAYQRIYNEYYRDQNLMSEIEISNASGEVSLAELERLLQMRKRAWEKDYFTSALPWAQRGGDVSLPFDVNADINYKQSSELYWGSGATPDEPVEGNVDLKGGRTLPNPDNHIGDGTNSMRLENIDSIDVESGSVTINDLRKSVKLQEWLEKNARGGARYVEQILSHFGVTPRDARLQRPEYLGGGRQPVTISEVLSTFQGESGTETIPQGNMAGHGISVGNSNRFSKYFEEHGYVIGIMSVMPKTAYQQGIPRHFLRKDKFDYYWPEFAHLGEQEIKMAELFYDGRVSEETNDQTFGYTPRYSEYKYMPNTVHGEMKDSLSFWHMGRIFQNTPALNGSFVEADPTTRIFAVEEEEHLYCQLYNKVDAIRPMPYFGTPRL